VFVFVCARCFSRKRFALALQIKQVCALQAVWPVSLEALHHAAAALPHVDIAKPQSVIGTNTVACMQSGVYWGYIGLVREICARIRAERDTPMQVIGTGGLAPLFEQGETLFDHYEDDLTRHGLTVIHRYNKEHGN
jgi:type III pantothenate kinase